MLYLSLRRIVSQPVHLVSKFLRRQQVSKSLKKKRRMASSSLTVAGCVNSVKTTTSLAATTATDVRK